MAVAEPQPPEGLRKIVRNAIENAECVHDADYYREHGVFLSSCFACETDAVLAALFEACEVYEQPHMWLGDGTRDRRSLVLRYPLPDEPMPEAGPMHPDLAAALARAKAQVDAAHEPSDDDRTPDALVALGQEPTADTIPTEEPR